MSLHCEITVNISDENANDLSKIRIRSMGDSRFTVEFVINRGSTLGLVRRNFDFEGYKGNVLPLLKAALETLEDRHLEYEVHHGDVKYLFKELEIE